MILVKLVCYGMDIQHMLIVTLQYLDHHRINYIPFAGRGSNVTNGYPPRSNDFNSVENVISIFKEKGFLKNLLKNETIMGLHF